MAAVAGGHRAVGGVHVPAEEVDQRLDRIRAAMERDGLDALVVAGSEYSGFEGAVTYVSGFLIVHRYAYVLLPVAGEPSIVFPSEARYVGEHGTTWIEEQVFVDHPGEWLRDRARDRGWSQVGAYGRDYVMTVRDFGALSDGPFALVPWDLGFDHARAVKSDWELGSVRDSVRINTEGFWIFLDEFGVGRSEAELLAPCERWFVDQGCGRLTMDMVLVGERPDGSVTPEFRIASPFRRVRDGDLLLPSLEVAGPGGHWVEVSRAIAAGEPSAQTRRMLEAYEEYFEAAGGAMRPGATAHDVHRAVARGFVDRGFRLGHVTGHSIGMTMIEFPKIGEGVETELEANMVFSMHPHAISDDGRECLYMQDTWLVTPGGGEPLAGLPMRIFRAGESRP